MKKLTEDYPVTGHNRVSTKGKRHAVQPHARGEKKKQVLAKVKKLKKQPKKYYDKIQFKDLKKKIKSLDGSLKILAKKMELGDEQSVIDYYLLLKYRNRLADQKFWLQGEILFSKKDLNLDTFLSECVSAGFDKYKGDKKFEAKTQDQKLGFLHGICRQKTMDFLGISLFPIVSKVISEIIIPVIKRDDSISFSEFRQIKTDFYTEDFVIFHGPIARDGPYEYQDDNGNPIILHKDIDNLSDIYSRYQYLPIRASEKPGAHHAEELGYGTNFMLNQETNEIEADLVLVNDERFKEILKKRDKYHVSPGYSDIVKNNIQIITDLDHIAFALGEEMSRACTGTNEKGSSCTEVKKIYHDQNQITEVI